MVQKVSFVGQKVADTGPPILVPVGSGILGCMINGIGEPIDECGVKLCFIHADPPPLVEQSTITSDVIGLAGFFRVSGRLLGPGSGRVEIFKPGTWLTTRIFW